LKDNKTYRRLELQKKTKSQQAVCYSILQEYMINNHAYDAECASNFIP